MRTHFPRTLRWQITLALFGLVAVTLTVSWALAVTFTARDFEEYVTADALEQSLEYAHLLEVLYNLQGGLENIEQFLLGASLEESENHDEDMVVAVTDAAVSEWEWILAERIGIPMEGYWDERMERSPVEIAWEYDVSADELVTAIMRAEVLWARSEPLFGEADLLWYLESVLADAEAYVWGIDDVGVTAGLEDDFGIPFLHEAPILVLDASGTVLFDGAGETDAGDRMDLDEDFDGAPIRDWQTDQVVGMVLPARDPWLYDEDEALYLDRTRDGLLIGGGVAAALALILGAFLSYRISRPIVALRDSATRLSSGEAIERLPVTPGELGSMSAAFNAMADSLEQQRDVRSRMVSDLSHELNTPLAVIQLEIEALRDGMQSPEEAADHVLAELDLLRNLASDVGLIAENEAGLLSMHKEAVDLDDFVPSAVQRWKTQADSVGIRLEIVNAGYPVLAELDPTRVSQALGNLIRNALQHTAAGGTIAIQVDRRSIDRLGGVWNTICVTDTGSGIAPEHLAHIFDRKVRGQTTKTGRGLGLTIVRQIVEAHNGHVWAESTPGKGSVFCIALP